MRINCLPLALVVAASICGSAPASAQRSNFSDGLVEVIEANRFVNEPSGTIYRLGQDLILTVRGTTQARMFAREGFNVRIFALGASSSTPGHWAWFDPCYVFLSLLLSNVPIADGRMNLGNLRGLDFLTVRKGKAVSNGRFLVVFERTSDQLDLVRLRQAESKSYFAQALYIEVAPNRRYDQVEIDRHASMISAEVLVIRADARRNARSFRCYRYKAAGSNRTAVEQLAHLRDCGADPAGAPSPRTL
jgi:hypothetical protein